MFKKILYYTCVAGMLVSMSSCSILQGKKDDKSASQSKEKSKNGIKPYGKIITKKAKTDEGLFTVHKVDEDYFFEIPDSLFNREMLMVTRIAQTAQGMGFGGGKQNEQVLRWQRKGDKVNLRVVSYDIAAADSLPIYEAVVNSNFEPILYSFDVKAYKKDSIFNTTVIDVTDLFQKDVEAIGLQSRRRKPYKISRLDDSRSYIDTIRSYPENIEIRHVKTYNAGKPPSNSSTGSVSLKFSNSMVLLPKEPMRRRYFDQRVGWFTSNQTDYGLDNQKSETVEYLDRYRLEVKDENLERFKNGELVEPKEQIIYYIDRATPEKWRKYIKQGIEDWQVAFEAAGFKNAIIAMDPPTKEEDPDWSPEDVRYSVVRYLASPIPNANGPHVSDPRSGEILESDINWYHNVMTLLRNWFFVQTAAINPEARGVEFKDEVMGRLIRFVSSHEVGHTLGLPHNMGSSVAYGVEDLRSPEFTKEFGTAPSIMDYARFNYIAQPGDGDVSLMPNVGPYDKYSIAWGYRPILDKTPEEEKEVLNRWILEKAGDPIYRFGKQQSGGVIDPSSQTEDLGDDSMEASTYGIENLKRIVPNLIEWTAEDGKNYEDLEDLYNQVYGQYNRYMGHVAANIGGVYEIYKTYDQEGDVYTHAPRDKQVRAMEFLQAELFETPEWLIDTDIFNKIQFDGYLEKIKSYQERALNNVLDFGRFARMMENEELNDDAYTIVEMMENLRTGLFSELRRGEDISRIRRNLQRAYIGRMHELMTEEQSSIPAQFRSYINRSNIDVETSDIRPLVRAELTTLQVDMRRAINRTRDTMTRYHLQDAVERIEKIINPDA
ncbi:zinc-dependent metalloprotease [Psychroflexus torquis ATCC 700755]|uniref:Zinc-dependent metalloprotease n=1 Tax=Psychroflexus torquis (strain ATCC 700755 / CIP 106069 / ACAM 623) TaxID=313595 RepID=K4IRG7_PSYTT|nr:zinc-dependent metalloprotease [Psychroflexus torquis]AFU68050.1 zinc-dependent metalloprotease [Psychroflexus torquis ATCC 700755]